jgi:hypothetical protein
MQGYILRMPGGDERAGGIGDVIAPKFNILPDAPSPIVLNPQGWRNLSQSCLWKPDRVTYRAANSPAGLQSKRAPKQ